MTKIKILWQSENPTFPTGYGNVSRYICKGLSSVGMDVHVVSWIGENEKKLWDNCTLHSSSPVGWGANSIQKYVLKLSPNLVITFGDPTWLLGIVRVGLDSDIRRRGGKWVVYYTLDGENVDGKVPEEWANMINVADIRITCSRYAVEVSRRSGVTAEYIPHGVDTEVFCPPINKQLAKRRLGYEGKFVVLSDARNQPRKMLPRLLKAFACFARNKSDVILHLHTDPDDPWASSDIRKLIKQLGIGDKVYFTAGFKISEGISIGNLAGTYQASDIHILSSGGEGFGLPTLQACSSGIVPMAANYTTNIELIRGHGELFKVEGFQIGRYGLKVAQIDIQDCADKMEKYYVDRELLIKKSQEARRFALNFSWSKVNKSWYSLLEKAARSKTPKDTQNPWVIRGNVVLGHNTSAGDKTIISRIRPFIQTQPGVRISMDVVCPMPKVNHDEKEVAEFISHLKQDPSRTKNPNEGSKLNKLCCIEDWDNNEIRKVLADLHHPTSFIHRKAWEWAVGILAMRKFGKLRKELSAIGIGCSKEPGLFYLANNLNHVYAIDCSEGKERKEAVADFSVNPSKYVSFPYDKNAFTALRMDTIQSQFSSDTFELAFYFSSSEQFCEINHEAMWASLKEIQRLLKPGGIAVISTEYIINNKNHPGFFNSHTIYSDLIDKLEMELVEPIDLRITPTTLDMMMNYFDSIRWQSMPDQYKVTHPVILLRLYNILYTSVMLVLRKK